MNKTLQVITICLACLLITGFLATPVFAQAGVLFVGPGGDDTNDCLTEATACLTINAAIGKAAEGATINVLAGTYQILTSTDRILLNKANITVSGAGAGSTIFETNVNAGYVFYVTANGVTLNNLEIHKLDKAGPQNLVYVQADNFTLSNCLLHGDYAFGDPEVSRGMEVAYGSENMTITGNTFHHLRQPGYLNGSLAAPTTGTIANNLVYTTRGWVIAGANMAFTDNTWTSGGEVNVFDVAILAATPAAYYTNLIAVSQANNDAVIEDQRLSPALLTVVYVDDSAVSAGDGGPSAPYPAIQTGISRVMPGGTVNVSPGDYSETAANSYLFNNTGPYTFGLFIADEKSGITVQGVDASGAPITGYADVAASVTTNATNSFGHSGVFVEGDNVTLSGLRFLPNTPSDNKTIEVIGDNFSLEASIIDVPGGGSVYLNDWRFDEDTDESYLQSYSILNNLFSQGATLDIASGAGYTGPVAGRLIQGNSFENTAATRPAISFSGNSVVPWFTYPVNGATITGNTFVGTTQHIRARGGYDNTTFDWLAYRANNTFDKTVLAFVGDTTEVRSYEYLTGYCDKNGYCYMHNVRRLTASIQFGVDDAIDGDTVDVSAGAFTEQVVISEDILLQGADGASIIQAYNDMPTCFTTSEPAKPVVCVKDTNDATITGFTVDGLGLGKTNNRFYGIAFRNAGGTVQNNTVRDVHDTPFSGAQHGNGIYAYNDDANARTLHILDNTVTGFQKNGITANASDTNRLTVDIQRNTVTGQGPTNIIAQNGIQVWANAGEGVVADNIISGIAYDNTLNPTKWVATSILNYYADLDTTGNTITGAHMGIYYWEGRGLIENNDLTIEKVGVYAYGINAADPPQAVPSPFDAPASTQASTQLAPNGAGINVAVLVIPVEISHNTLTFSGPDKTATYGIEADAGYENNDLSVDIHHNTVNGFEYGLTFYQCTASCGLGAFESISAVSNNLTDNTVGIYFGGAIPADVVPVLHHNRIFGDVTTDTGLVNDLTVEVKAENNWWGCNAGPADAACVGITGLVDANPWLVLTFTADQTTLVSGSVIHLTANLSRNSAGLDTTALGSVMDGFVIEFDTTYGTLDPLSAGMVNASTATALTVPNPITVNTATVSAEFDNQVVEIVFNGWIYIFLPLIFR